jgi:dCTP diphosphatase
MELIDIRPITRRLQEFADERDWGRFHTPKNLAMALAAEAGEVLAELQWMSDAEIAEMLSESGTRKQALADELSDVMIYLARLAAISKVDLDRSVAEKIERNGERFPPTP